MLTVEDIARQSLMDEGATKVTDSMIRDRLRIWNMGEPAPQYVVCRKGKFYHPGTDIEVPKHQDRQEGTAMKHQDRQEGLYNKFKIERTNRSPKHEGCEYFVLDLTHDPFAGTALLAYLRACRKEFPLLAADLALELCEPGRPWNV